MNSRPFVCRACRCHIADYTYFFKAFIDALLLAVISMRYYHYFMLLFFSLFTTITRRRFAAIFRHMPGAAGYYASRYYVIPPTSPRSARRVCSPCAALSVMLCALFFRHAPRCQMSLLLPLFCCRHTLFSAYAIDDVADACMLILLPLPATLRHAIFCLIC